MLTEKLAAVTTIILSVYLSSSEAGTKLSHPHFNRRFERLASVEGCPTTLVVHKHSHLHKISHKLNTTAIKTGLENFPGVHSNLHHHINTYKLLNNRSLEQLDESKVNTLINLKKVIYSSLNIESEEQNQHPEVQFGFKCPKRGDIEPCICTTTDVPTLNCSGVNSFVTLKQILNSAEFPSTNFGSFKYYPQNPSEEQAILFDNTFGPLSFKQIFIGQSGLKELEKHALNGSEITLQLFMSDGNKNLQSFPFENILKQHKNLNTLTIVRSLIDQVPALNSPSLKYLDLNTNNIKTVEYDVFAKLSSLIVVDLSYNNIENVDSKGLYISSPDCIIYLNQNQLKEVSPFPCHQPFLLEESHNFLTTFSEDVYRPILDRMAYVDVTSNNIDCSELQWVDDEPEYEPHVISDCQL